MNAIFRLTGAALIALAFGIGYLLDDLVNGAVPHPATVGECLLVVAIVGMFMPGLVLFMLGRHVLADKSPSGASIRR